MTTRTVTYCSYTKLSCVGQTLPDVVLCLTDTALVKPGDCDYEYSFIEAKLCQAYSTGDGCLNNLWHYTFQYNDELLNTGDLLASSDIAGVFCKDCLTTWAEEKIGNEVTLVTNDDGQLVFTSQHGCTTTFLPGGGGFTVQDTETVNLTYEDLVLSADVNVSSLECNQLRVKSDGLYVGLPLSSDPGNMLEWRSDGLYLSCENMGCCNSDWVDFSSTAVLTYPGSSSGQTIDQAKYKRANGVVFIKFDLRVTLSGTTGISVRLRPPVTGVPDDDQVSYILGGAVNGVGEPLNWRYDASTGDIIFFRDAAAVITNGAFEVHLSDFYEEVA